MSQTKKHCEPLVAAWLRPSTTEPCICCKQVAEKPLGEHLKIMYVFIYLWYGTHNRVRFQIKCALSKKEIIISTTNLITLVYVK